MCGRYSLSTDPNQLKAQFGDIETGQSIEANYNIAPTQYSYVIADDHPTVLQQFKWGLIPFWAKDEKIGSRMINARSEGIENKPSFRAPIRRRRCLVLADSFYEWIKRDGKKFPQRILMKDESIMVMAGIWEVWSKGPAPVYSYSIITCPPNEEMVPIHNRMPVVFPYQDQWEEWLSDIELNQVLDMLHTPDNDILKIYEVSTQVNNVRNNGPELHKPI
jgi:putative SOS response-associated peptidase YedK